jgi:hypothetical protein
MPQDEPKKGFMKRAFEAVSEAVADVAKEGRRQKERLKHQKPEDAQLGTGIAEKGRKGARALGRRSEREPQDAEQ